MKSIIIKSSWAQENNLRLDASYHLSDGPLTLKKLKESKLELTSLQKESSSIFKGNIFKRSYVLDSNKGLPFMTASDMMKTELKCGKFVSKKFTRQAGELLLKKGWILISRSGTLGNTAYVNENFEGIIGSDDLIRVVPNELNINKELLYVYLSSKYGYGLLTQSGYGGVVKHIEPEQIQNLPIPIFSEPIQQEVKELILEASKLRVEASKVLSDAVHLMESALPNFCSSNVYVSRISQRQQHSLRLDSTYQTNSIDKFYSDAQKTGAILKSVRNISELVFTPNIFKRVRVANPEMGIPFLSGSDLLAQMPSFKNYLSRKMKNIENYILREGWLAIQDAGTIGYVTLVNSYLDGVSATNNLVRVIPQNHTNHNYYLYCFLKTQQGQKLLKSLEYGSVQKHIDNSQVSNMLIPIVEDIFDEVSEKIKRMLINQGDACKLEREAINLVEKEIESWQ